MQTGVVLESLIPLLGQSLIIVQVILTSARPMDVLSLENVHPRMLFGLASMTPSTVVSDILNSTRRQVVG